MVNVYQATNVGKVREVNEDSCAVLESDVYVLADGMGGHAAGEIASHIMVDTVRKLLSETGISYSELVLKKVIQQANQAILAEAAQVPEQAGMGTTVVLLHREGNIGQWAQVGDSRLYLLHDGVLQQVTRDHSLVEDLVQNGTITREEARSHPRRNILTRAVGVEENVIVDTGVISLTAGDTLLLCSDGLTNMVSDAEIRDILQERDGNDKAAELVERALSAGGSDNITVIVMEYDNDAC